MNKEYTIFPLGDTAITIELGKQMTVESNEKVLAIRNYLEGKKDDSVIDTIIGYNSLTIFYNPVLVRKNETTQATAYETMCSKIETAYKSSREPSRLLHESIKIPVCYHEQFAMDMMEVSIATNLSVEDVVKRHTSKSYRVYMLGFLPGFAYLGELDASLQMPRKPLPANVVAGSIGIVSNQTGIYPLNSPGGWQIIGRTPLSMFQPNEIVPVKLKPGDEVEFYEISVDEFHAW